MSTRDLLRSYEVCMWVCMYKRVYMYICIRVYTRVLVYTHIHTHINTHTHTHTRTCAYVYTHIYIRRIYIFVCVYVWVCVYKCYKFLHLILAMYITTISWVFKYLAISRQFSNWDNYKEDNKTFTTKLEQLCNTLITCIAFIISCPVSNRSAYP